MKNNIIYQYMVIDDDTAARGRIGSESRSKIYKESSIISRRSFGRYVAFLKWRLPVGKEIIHHFSTKRVLTKKYEHAQTQSVLFEILRIIYDPLYDDYDWVLYADSDIICNTNTNIFDLCDDSFDVAGVLESDILTENNGGYNVWDYDENKFNSLAKKFDRLNIPIISTDEANIDGVANKSKVLTFNTGMLLWSKSARLKARECFDSWEDYMMDGILNEDPLWTNNDQPFISSQLTKHGFKLKALPQTWNDTPTHWSDDRGYDMNFLHYTGGDGSVQLINDYKKGRFKYLKP